MSPADGQIPRTPRGGECVAWCAEFVAVLYQNEMAEAVCPCREALPALWSRHQLQARHSAYTSTPWPAPPPQAWAVCRSQLWDSKRARPGWLDCGGALEAVPGPCPRPVADTWEEHPKVCSLYRRHSVLLPMCPGSCRTAAQRRPPLAQRDRHTDAACKRYTVG